MFGHVVPQTGVDPHHFAVDILMKDMGWLGYSALSLRSDTGSAIFKFLRHPATEARIKVKAVEQVLEQRPKLYDHAGKGEIEAVVKQLTRIMRTNKLDLKRSLGKEIPQGPPS